MTDSADDRLRAPQPTEAERREVVERIQHAMVNDHLAFDEIGPRFRQVYDAQSGADLARVVSDLPEPTSRRTVGHPVGSSAFSLIGDVKRGGWVAFGERFRAVSIIGDINLDLSTAELGSRGVTVAVYAAVGDVKVIVPDGARARIEGFGAVGDQKVDLVAPLETGAEIIIKSYSLLGDVTVQSLSRVTDRSLKRLWKQLRS